MKMVGKYYFENFSSIRNHRMFPRAVSLRNVLAFARSAQLKKIKQNRFKLLSKDRIYYLGSNMYLHGNSKKVSTPVRIICSVYS